MSTDFEMVTTSVTHDSARSVQIGELYPSYKSFDSFVDLDRLRSLDSYLTKKIKRHIAGGLDDYFVNEHVLEDDAPYKPGVREIWLTRTTPGRPYDYLDINRSELWRMTDDATEFTLLMEFIETLPFASTGRILLIYDEGGNSVPAHRDHERMDICHDFIWFRTNTRKPFYVLNQVTGAKCYIDGYSAWFDTVNQYHGSDSAEGLTFSFRVDGHFTPEFRERFSYTEGNRASTPAAWAISERGEV